MKNIEKIKELNDYQLLEIINMIHFHATDVQYRTGAYGNLDAFDLKEDNEDIILSWLNSEYDEEKGFVFAMSDEKVYIYPDKIEPPFWYDPNDNEQITKMIKSYNRKIEYDE